METSSPQPSLQARSSPNQPERSVPSDAPRTTSPNASIVINDGAAKQKLTPDGKRSPMSLIRSRHGNPKIIVKREPPSSPEVPATARHRPRKLDLSSSNTQNQASNSAKPSAPLTSRESGGMAMHDVGLACLSPGFQTQDPTMQQQLQRSISVRDQQRHIIESRLQKTAKPVDSDGRNTTDNPFGAGMKTPSTSKKRPPNGLSIVPPSHEQFANERVIQSAPLNQTFTGRHQPHPMTRHVANQPSNLSNTSHIHHVPATQTSNRLPPISDVFAGEGLGMPRKEGHYHSNSNSNSSHSNHRPTFPSPGQPPPSSHPPLTSRDREYLSADEHVAEITHGREELLPKVIHYRSNHPPTPPTPPTQAGATSHRQSYSHLNGEALRSGRRRPRNEYERDMGTPPLGSGPDTRERRGPFGMGIDSPETQRRKKEEFLGLCSRAWELFHS
ncbi:uncharacterized protein KY384_003753 [Bacidia gigantensis]|uniref:uncharacterized protein n=1 Tax=Bacidia gigantensis TaxID=2732470 RepID=UPI001D04833F|nr:uncharacterized protein KY384_003753 [Bacidia gigantensis]KAG8532116.1 hypothetical protein KY384_003753 [Bacidia gigantensis]